MTCCPPKCRRLPSDPSVVFDKEYMKLWVGGKPKAGEASGDWCGGDHRRAGNRGAGGVEDAEKARQAVRQVLTGGRA